MLPAVAPSPLGSPVLPEVNLIVVTSVGRVAHRRAGGPSGPGRSASRRDLARRPDARRAAGRSVNSSLRPYGPAGAGSGVELARLEARRSPRFSRSAARSSSTHSRPLARQDADAVAGADAQSRRCAATPPGGSRRSPCRSIGLRAVEPREVQSCGPAFGGLRDKVIDDVVSHERIDLPIPPPSCGRCPPRGAGRG